MNRLLRVAVLASGRGSNFAALMLARECGDLPIEFVLVASDKADAGALALAKSAGVATLVLDPRQYADRRAFDLELFRHLAESGAELLVMAGFMRIIDGEALTPWIGRMINIHPSLLPRYRGLHTHRRALAAGDREHGASVHYVTAELDGGPVIAQVRMAIEPDDDEQRLAQRLLPLEHRLLVTVVTDIAAGRLALDGDSVRFEQKALAQPLQWLDGRLVAMR